MMLLAVLVLKVTASPITRSLSVASPFLSISLLADTAYCVVAVAVLMVTDPEPTAVTVPLRLSPWPCPWLVPLGAGAAVVAAAVGVGVVAAFADNRAEGEATGDDPAGDDTDDDALRLPCRGRGGCCGVLHETTSFVRAEPDWLGRLLQPVRRTYASPMNHLGFRPVRGTT